MRTPVFVLDPRALRRRFYETEKHRRGEQRRLNGHGHAVAGERVDEAAGVADHEHAAFDRGASLFRVHDVRSHVEALAVAAAVERGTVTP